MAVNCSLLKLGARYVGPCHTVLPTLACIYILRKLKKKTVRGALGSSFSSSTPEAGDKKEPLSWCETGLITAAYKIAGEVFDEMVHEEHSGTWHLIHTSHSSSGWESGPVNAWLTI